ncbi:LamG-like jellyroll fold domain-containing protein [Solirubrum puertoriconensis]|uniref:LamG-like jellyroll fold domain-containing protein n=1 Tax=Solirubrum puertoriconensis TaxID=1751427 RepID=A0A9X0HM70_SOLP1|nr:LamG-like jellyroll fold domain-containing protein [Solirubrum puertoriconensis]KUG08426.1 hypothetical protein ASU33_09675 [Solirubrum puertoriconensis]
MKQFIRKACVLTVLGTGLSLSSQAQRGGNFLGLTSAESDKVSVNLNAPAGPFTLEAWVYYSGTAFVNGGIFNTIMEFGNDAPWFGVNQTGELQVYNTVIGGTVPVRTWTHVAYTWDGTTSRLYIDGNEVKFSTTAPPTTGTTMGIGYHSSDTGWQGYLDEVMIWNVARTPAQIQSDRQNGNNTSSPALLAYFKFDESTGQAAMSQATLGPHGVLGSTNAPEPNDPIFTSAVVNSTRPRSEVALGKLQPTFPNPVVGQGSVPFSLTRSGHVRLSVLDATGKEVATLLDEVKPAGSHTAQLPLGNLSAGVYMCQLTFDGQRHTQRMVVQ